MIAIIDYGMGNLRSVSKAAERCGARVKVVNSPEKIDGADGLILPGVGAFGAGMRNLQKRGFIKEIKKHVRNSMPLLGICLGYQLLFDRSTEQGIHNGLGIIPGEVVKFKSASGIRIPHMGWNSLRTTGRSILYKNIPDGSYMYFVHSYYCRPAEKSIVTAWTKYDVNFAASIEKKYIFGTQFHPEKSGSTGLKVLKNFVEYTKNRRLK